MKKKIITIMTMLLWTVVVSAMVFEVDGIQYGNKYANKDCIPLSEGLTVEVRSNGYSGDVVIPSEVEYEGDYYSVTGIESSAFSGCSSLTSITIPNSVTSIGEGAFEGCSSLTSVTIPNSVTSIGIVVFYGCSALTSIVVDDGNTKYDSRDGCNAIIETATNTLILGCRNTVIPNSVTNIEDNAFNGCSSLTSITIPNSVTSIGASAFSGCSNLTSITIPNSVTSICASAFAGCI